MGILRSIGWMLAGSAAAALLAVDPGRAAAADLTELIEGAKQDGEVHYIDALVQPKTHAALERAFRKKYGLPDSFKVTHTLQGTGQVVASVQQEIKAGKHTFDLVSVGAPGFYKAGAKEGDFVPYLPPEWVHYEGLVKRLGIEADPPNWLTPTAYSFVPVWNRKCAGFAEVQIKGWGDMLNPAFKGKMIVADVRKSFTYAATWVGIEGKMGKDYFPQFVKLTQPVIIFRTEESLQKVISCEYPIQLMQLSGRVYQRVREDPNLELGVSWPQEGVVILGTPIAIVKGSPHPNAAKLFENFLLSEEGMREYIGGEGVFTLREGFNAPAALGKFTPEVDKVTAMPVDWAALTLQGVRKVQDEFRKILQVD